MPDLSAAVEMPKRALLKGSEVCELLQVQPYVLRSWEAEFPQLGVAKTPGGPRVYRQGDVEQVRRIRHLLLVDGLTLAGVRRKLEEDAAPVGDEPLIDELIGQNARERLTEVKRGLRSILELLTREAAADGASADRGMRTASRMRSMPGGRSAPVRRKTAPGRSAARGKGRA